MGDCIFCKILAGDISAKTLFEDDQNLALLDAFPLTEGHALVIPKTHYERLQDMPSKAAQSLFAVAHHLLPKVQSGMNAQAMTVGLNNGKLAGQVVPHVHLHLIPRYEGDGGGTLHAVVKQENQRPVDQVYEQLKPLFLA